MEPFAKFPEKSSKDRTFRAVFYSGPRFPSLPAVSCKYNEPKAVGKHVRWGLLWALGLLAGKAVRREGKAEASPPSPRLWPHCSSELF